jgi:hypothetical protein
MRVKRYLWMLGATACLFTGRNAEAKIFATENRFVFSQSMESSAFSAEASTTSIESTDIFAEGFVASYFEAEVSMQSDGFSVTFLNDGAQGVIKLSWNQAFSEFKIERAYFIDSANWEPIGTGTVDNRSEVVIELPIENRPVFFRLVKP